MSGDDIWTRSFLSSFVLSYIPLLLFIDMKPSVTLILLLYNKNLVVEWYNYNSHSAKKKTKTTNNVWLPQLQIIVV